MDSIVPRVHHKSFRCPSFFSRLLEKCHQRYHPLQRFLSLSFCLVLEKKQVLPEKVEGWTKHAFQSSS